MSELEVDEDDRDEVPLSSKWTTCPVVESRLPISGEGSLHRSFVTISVSITNDLDGIVVDFCTEHPMLGFVSASTHNRFHVL